MKYILTTAVAAALAAAQTFTDCNPLETSQWEASRKGWLQENKS